MTSLKEKTAVVTGGSRGFGRGIVEALASEGMRVIALARNAESLNLLQKEVRGEIVTIAGDVTDPLLAARVIAEYRFTFSWPPGAGDSMANESRSCLLKSVPDISKGSQT